MKKFFFYFIILSTIFAYSNVSFAATVKPNQFTGNWKSYRDVFNKVSSEHSLDSSYVLAAYSATECNMNENQFNPYTQLPKNGKNNGYYLANFKNPHDGKTYKNVLFKNGRVCAAVGITSVQSEYYTNYSIEKLYDVKTNLSITADEFKNAKKKYKTIHDIVAYVFYPSDLSYIDKIKKYAGTNKTYWQVFVDNYNNIKQQDGLKPDLKY